jgi:hypothetical protein
VVKRTDDRSEDVVSEETFHFEIDQGLFKGWWFEWQDNFKFFITSMFR